MQWLWLTLADPDPPHNGQFVYSGGLIRSCARSGVEVVVLGLRRPGSPSRDGMREGSVTWYTPDDGESSRWASLGSALPHLANRCRTPGMRAALMKLLPAAAWDAIVFDSISAGWALSIVQAYFSKGPRPKLIYVSHNHEHSLRKSLASNRSGIVKRNVQALDASKVSMLEHALIKEADFVTAITTEDRDLYRAQWPDKKIETLAPGYSGRALAAREIGECVPRRAVIVGSFDWIAKRINLEEFVRAADPIFAAQDIELQVVGSGEKSYFDQLQNRLTATQFTGEVAHVEDFLDQARIAILPERVGGGFKLKVLDYVFNRMPVFAIKGSVAGTPLRENHSVLLYSNQESLARGVLRMIDNLGFLNGLQNQAFDDCRHHFDWESRGHRLASAIGAL